MFGIKLFKDNEYLEWNQIKQFQFMLTQIILLCLIEKFQNDKIFLQRYENVMALVEDNPEMDIFNRDEKIIGDYYHGREEILKTCAKFYMKNDFWILPQFISNQKSATCIGFVFRVLDKHSIYQFNKNFVFTGKKINNGNEIFFNYVNSFVKKNILVEVSIKEFRVGDIIMFIENEFSYEHIGFVYDKKMNILSKHGHDCIYIEPMNGIFFRGLDNIKIFRINDENYYNKFENKFKPAIEKMKLNKKELLKYVEKMIQL